MIRATFLLLLSLVLPSGSAHAAFPGWIPECVADLLDAALTSVGRPQDSAHRMAYRLKRQFPGAQIIQIFSGNPAMPVDFSPRKVYDLERKNVPFVFLLHDSGILQFYPLPNGQDALSHFLTDWYERNPKKAINVDSVPGQLLADGTWPEFTKYWAKVRSWIGPVDVQSGLEWRVISPDGKHLGGLFLEDLLSLSLGSSYLEKMILDGEGRQKEARELRSLLLAHVASTQLALQVPLAFLRAYRRRNSGTRWYKNPVTGTHCLYMGQGENQLCLLEDHKYISLERVPFYGSEQEQWLQRAQSIAVAFEHALKEIASLLNELADPKAGYSQPDIVRHIASEIRWVLRDLPEAAALEQFPRPRIGVPSPQPFINFVDAPMRPRINEFDISTD